MGCRKMGELCENGKAVVIKGERSGSEELYVDGQVEGTIEWRNNNLIVGPNGDVKASVIAKGVVIQGKVEGKINATERVELRKSAVVNSDVVTQRIVMEEGAFFKGKIDIQREPGKAAATAS